MIRRGTLLASGLGALAIGVAGCGGGSGSAVGTQTNATGTTGTTGATMTATTSTGGVLGAQANVDRQKLRQQASSIQQMLNRQLDQLRSASSTGDLAAAATSIRSQLLKASDRLDRLSLQSPELQQQRENLSSGLRSLAADVTTLKGDAQSGDLGKAMNDLTNMSSLIQVRRSIDAIQQNGASGGGQALRNQASSIAGTLQTRLLAIAGTTDKQTFVKRVSQLQRFLNQRDQQVQNLNVPASMQQRKQTVLRFLHDWESTLDAARGEAAHGSFQQAKQQLVNGSLRDIQTLITGLNGSSGS